MNVHPSYFGSGAAKAMLQFIIQQAERARKPLRLISSALNLDSFSLYTRCGFVPQGVFQDMLLTVPAEGLPFSVADSDQVREATGADVPAIDRLERELSGISRTHDYRYFLEDRTGLWHASVYPGKQGDLAGFLVSLKHPAFTMLGPGLARDPHRAAALLLAELNHCRGRTVLFLVPAQCAPLVQQMYNWGARNCELHFSQVRGECPPVRGVQMPTFLPESG